MLEEDEKKQKDENDEDEEMPELEDEPTNPQALASVPLPEQNPVLALIADVYNISVNVTIIRTSKNVLVYLQLSSACVADWRLFWLRPCRRLQDLRLGRLRSLA